MKEFEYKELEKATENFSQSRLIGKGSHGCVYKGMLEEGKNIIAIKKQSLGLQKIQDNSKLENEVSILSSLPENSFIVNFLGTSHHYHDDDDSCKNETFLIMEYLPNGTLYQMLHAKNNILPNWPKRAQIAIQVAKAIQFLHQTKPNSIVHRDIKSANILFDSNWNAKLADLGLALRMKHDHHDESPSHSSNSVTRPAGTIGYLDPDYTKPSKLSTKNDVFSFGVLLFEIMSSRKAIDVSKSPVSIVDWATKLIKEGQSLEICDKRMHVPWYMEATIKNMLSIATRCVSPKKITRPTIEEIVMEMENVIIEPIKYPLWNILRGLTLLRRKRKRCRKNCCIITTNNVTKTCAQHERKLLIREILADKVTE